VGYQIKEIRQVVKTNPPYINFAGVFMKTLFNLNLCVMALALMVATTASTSARPQKAEETKLKSYITRATYYSFPRLGGGEDEPIASSSSNGSEQNSSSLQSTLRSSFSSPSPGVIVGNTIHDHQSNGSIHRQIQISQHHPDSAIVHFGWMYSHDICGAGSCWPYWRLRYNAYFGNIGDQMPFGAQTVSSVEDKTLYVVGDVIPSVGEYLAVGHNYLLSGTVPQPRGWWDQWPGLGSWVDSRIPDVVADDPAGSGSHFAWPAAAIQQYGGQTITHILACDYDDEQIKYFRKVGTRETGVWTADLVLDTANNLGYEVYASKTTGKVVLGWLANIPITPCDTCTQDAAQFLQWDNDFLIKVSTDAGATWGPKQNVTKNIDGVSGYRPYYDLSIMIDETDEVIAAWPARQWPSNANTYGNIPMYRCRIQFWRESFAPGVIRTVAGLEWDQTNCDLGVFKMNAGRTQVARCNGRTYVLWEQGNDFDAGIMNDCAERAGVGGSDDPTGAANSDLYVSISDDNGLTWDPARNITNTRTPDCDSATGAGGMCQSEVYPTLTPFGHNYSGDFTASGAQIPVAIPGTAGSNDGYYLECQYILDPHAGSAIRGEGPWFLADVMWARIECDTSVKTPVFSRSYNSIEYPAWVKIGTFRDTGFTIENTGNQNLTYSVSKYESNGPASWLAFSGFNGVVPSGLGNSETGQFRLNANASGTAGQTLFYTGGVVFVSNAPTSPDTIKINITIVDTTVPPSFDTIFVTSAAKATNRKGLAVTNNGGFGLGSIRVNLDFARYGDCDTTKTRYLTDGTVVVAYPTAGGTDTSAFYTFSEDYYTSEHGLRPVKGPIPTKKKTCPTQNFSLYYSGRFTTADTNITMEKTWYAPILSGTGSEDSSWFIQCLKVLNTSGASISGLAVGEFTDWDIPSDSGSDNKGGINPLKKLVYLQGGEFDDTNNIPALGYHDCQDDNRRFGGTRYLRGFKNAVALPADPAGAHVKEFSSEIGNDGLINHDSLVLRMQSTGYVSTDSVTDNVILMNFRKSETLGITDTLRFYTAWLSVRDGDTASLFTMSDRAASWFMAKNIASLRDTVCTVNCGCCVRRGDVNHGGSVSVSDATYLVKYLFVPGAPAPPCREEADVNGDGKVNVADLTYLVRFQFAGGPPPPPCPPCS
jgi:Dockerin type I domain